MVLPTVLLLIHTWKKETIQKKCSFSFRLKLLSLLVMAMMVMTLLLLLLFASLVRSSGGLICVVQCVSIYICCEVVLRVCVGVLLYVI